MKILSNSKAWKESITDTTIAGAINFPLNIVILSITMHFGMTAVETAIILFTAFTLLAIIRKYFIRIWFASKKI